MAFTDSARRDYRCRRPEGTQGHVAVPARLAPHDKYLRLLCLCLAGYALLGKGFAYVGYPPLLIGEITMILGLAVLLRSGCWIATLATVPSLVLVALISWVGLLTVAGFREYGLDSVRDGVVVLYGLFSFVVIALLLEDPRRLSWIVDAYGRFAWYYGLLGAGMVYVTSVFAHAMPIWPLSGVSIVYVKLNEAAVHLAGVGVFVVLGFRKVRPIWWAIFALGIVLITPSRGAMLSCLVPIGMAVVVGGKLRKLAPALAAGGLLFILGLATNVEIQTPEGRGIGPAQIVENVASIFGRSGEGNLDGTKQWRLRWWDAIEDYTLRGPYFWSGKGFGMSLAEADGFVVGQEKGGPILRSPHNVHYTLLARAGVVGLCLWLAFIAAWFATIFHSILVAKTRGDKTWENLFLWIACYVTAILIDASFDVALEGPMIGIWFWCLTGFGIGAKMIYGGTCRAPNVNTLCPR